jgi:hypothetical protein
MNRLMEQHKKSNVIVGGTLVGVGVPQIRGKGFRGAGELHASWLV